MARFRFLAAGSIAASLLVAGCATSTYNLGQQAERSQDYDSAVAQYTKAVREHPEDQDARMSLQRAKLRASQNHLVQGRRLLSTGRFEQAQIELQIASELDPVNGDIDRDLRAVRTALRNKLAAPADGRTTMETMIRGSRDLQARGFEFPDVKLGTAVSTGREITSRELFLLVAKLGNISVLFDSTFHETPAPVSLQASMTVRQALDAIAQSTSTFYRVTGPATITIAPDTIAKRREYAQEEVRTFQVMNADLKETQDWLRIVLDARFIAPMTGINTISVKDTPERLDAIGRLIGSIDKARPEVVIDVEILEVNRTKLREYGLQIASPGSPGINGSADANSSSLTLRSLQNLTDADVLMSGLPALYYRLLKTDTSTRTLANPHLRTIDGIAAKAGFGEDTPVPSTTLAPIATGGVNQQPITTYAYRTIGVNISITPRTHANDDVTLALDVELSNQSGVGFAGLPTFGKRQVTTTLRLKDGETNILAGLIRDDERLVKEGIPGLSDIPGIGHLFTHNKKEIAETDIVLMLTPHIVRVLDLTEDDLRPLRIQRDTATGLGLIEPSGVVPPPPIRGAGGGTGPKR